MSILGALPSNLPLLLDHQTNHVTVLRSRALEAYTTKERLDLSDADLIFLKSIMTILELCLSESQFLKPEESSRLEHLWQPHKVLQDTMTMFTRLNTGARKKVLEHWKDILSYQANNKGDDVKKQLTDGWGVFFRVYIKRVIQLAYSKKKHYRKAQRYRIARYARFLSETY